MKILLPFIFLNISANFFVFCSCEKNELFSKANKFYALVRFRFYLILFYDKIGKTVLCISFFDIFVS